MKAVGKAATVGGGLVNFSLSPPSWKAANATKKVGKLGIEDIDIFLVDCSGSIACVEVLDRKVRRDICR